VDIAIKDIASPLLSAFAASFITHWLTLRRSRADLLLKERAQAYSELHRKLVETLRYAQARAGEERGFDFGPTTETLSESERKSILEHFHDLRALQDMHFIYFPKAVLKRFDILDKRILLMCGHDLRCAADEHAPVGATGTYYESLADELRSTIEHLHEHSPLR
jgi:hypothetical protein